MNKVSNCDNATLPSVPPSDANNKSVAASVEPVKSLAVSISSVAVTEPNSSALAPEFTFNT